MKVYVLICLFMSVFFIQATPPKKGKYSSKVQITISQQLASLLTYPPFPESGLSRILVIQFQLSEENRICRVQVFSQNEWVNTHIIRQLTGQKLVTSNPDFSRIYQVKIRYSAL